MRPRYETEIYINCMLANGNKLKVIDRTLTK